MALKTVEEIRTAILAAVPGAVVTLIPDPAPVAHNRRCQIGLDHAVADRHVPTR